MQRRDVLRTGAAALGTLGAGWLNPARAQPQTISIVMPVGGGTGGDTSARVLADVVARKLKSAVIIENRPGADTMIANQYVLNGPTDGGRVLFISPSSMVILPLVNKNLDFNPQTQLQPVILTSRGGAALMVKSERFKTIEEFIAEARKEPGKISLATYGGHYYKLLALMIQRELGIHLNSVPYKDPTPAISNVIGGNVDAMLIDAGSAREFVRSGKTRVIALTHERRPDIFNDVPTFKEMGYPQLVSYIWIGYAVKAGTPPDMVSRLYQAFSSALKSKEYMDYMAATNSGAETIDFNSEQALQYIDGERKRFAALIEKTGYTV